jgi:hypothetical protein
MLLGLVSRAVSQTHTVWRRIHFDNLEINCPHAASDLENIAYCQLGHMWRQFTFADRSVCLQEVWSKVDVKETSRKSYSSAGAKGKYDCD